MSFDPDIFYTIRIKDTRYIAGFRYPFARLQDAGQKIQGTFGKPVGFPNVPQIARFFAAFSDLLCPEITPRKMRPNS
jgi:hypothetical protein